MSSGERWYIRVRGLVNGPYDLQRLRGLVARGKLSRIHEVSPDGQTWAPATSVYGLFDAQGSGGAAGAGDMGGGGFDTGADTYDPQPVADDWYYAANGAQSGPVSSDELRSMVQSGQLSPETLVWRSGLSAWSPAREGQELGLMPAAQSAPATRLSADPLLVGNIESSTAETQISQAVGLVVSGWHTVSDDGKQQDRDFVLGPPFAGPYEKLTSGDTVAFNPLRPKEGLGVYKTKGLYKKVGDVYRQLPDDGVCVTPVSGPSRIVHQLAGTGTCFNVTADG